MMAFYAFSIWKKKKKKSLSVCNCWEFCGSMEKTNLAANAAFFALQQSSVNVANKKQLQFLFPMSVI